jgi:hypothetical protein
MRASLNTNLPGKKDMTKQGKLNLLAMFLLPVGAIIGARLATASGVWLAYGDTYVYVFAMNAIITVPAALMSGLFLRRSTGERARWIAILPTVLPAIYGAVWYIWRGIFPAEVAAGAEYLGAPQYLLIGMLAITLLVLLVRLTGLAPRTV